MEELPDKKGLVYKHRKPIAIIVFMVFVVPLAIIIPNLINDNRSDLELSHSLTVWILPEEEEFQLNFGFYVSEQYAEEQVNSLLETSFGIQPLDDEEHFLYLINIPDNLESVWVRLCFHKYEDAPYTVLRIDMGQTKTSTLSGREISILVQPYLG